MPEDAIPDAVADLISETFSEPELDEPAAEDAEGEDGEEAPEPPSEEDRIAATEDKVDALKSELVGVKQKLIDLDSDVEALEWQQKTEIEAISDSFSGTARELSAHLKPIKAEHKEAVKALKPDTIFRNINRREKAKGNANVVFELVMEMDEGSELIVKRSWSAGAVADPRPKDLSERLVVVRDGKRVSVQNREIWQDFIRAAIPPGITQFFFFNGEKIQEIAADDHSEVRLKSSLEAALGIQNINRLASDLAYIQQEERKGFVEISDEDLEFKQSELKKEKSKLTRKNKERVDLQGELKGFREQLSEAKKRFEFTFQSEPETHEAMREQEKRRIQASTRLTQVENEIRAVCERSLPFALAGKLFDGIRQQIEKERESATVAAIKENAAELAKRLVRVVEEPEPIYREQLSPDKMLELESRIVRLLKEGDGRSDVTKVLDLSDRDVARVLNQMENIERSEVFFIQPLIEEKTPTRSSGPHTRKQKCSRNNDGI